MKAVERSGPQPRSADPEEIRRRAARRRGILGVIEAWTSVSVAGRCGGSVPGAKQPRRDGSRNRGSICGRMVRLLGLAALVCALSPAHAGRAGEARAELRRQETDKAVDQILSGQGVQA